MQINLIIPSFIHLSKQMFIEYLLGRNDVAGNEYFCMLSMGSVWWGRESWVRNGFFFLRNWKLIWKNRQLTSKLEDRLLPDRNDLWWLAGGGGFVFQEGGGERLVGSWGRSPTLVAPPSFHCYGEALTVSQSVHPLYCGKRATVQGSAKLGATGLQGLCDQPCLPLLLWESID